MLLFYANFNECIGVCRNKEYLMNLVELSWFVNDTQCINKW